MGEITPLRSTAGGRFTPPAPITSAHDLSHFGCGKDPLDDWLRHHALTSEGRSARTYVVCEGNTVVGYYCLATGSERRANMPRKIKQGIPDPTPLMIIGRLAVDRNYQGHGFGKGLLKDALKRTLSASEIVGSRAVLVHAIDKDAVAFYAQYGFIEFPLGSQTMFLPTETIAKAL
jgi:GNAT superfamily N-acetyltransferase